MRPRRETVLREALELEPNCVFAHAKDSTCCSLQKISQPCATAWFFLEDNAGYRFKDALGDPLWDEFKKAPESARWR